MQEGLDGEICSSETGTSSSDRKTHALLYEMAQWPLIPTHGRQRQSDLRSA